MSESWVEVWSRPGASGYGRKIADVPVTNASATVPYNGVGRGEMRIPRGYDRLDDILLTDPATGVGEWSTIRHFSEKGWLYDWLPYPRVPEGTKDDPDVEISGEGIESIVGFARVEPWDWDGSASFVSTFPDWIYGGRNLLGNPGFEDSPCRPEINQVTIDPTVSGGTFTLSDGVDTTAGIPYNEAASNIEGILESDITAIDDVNVTGSGTPTDPYVITFVTPCTFPGGLFFDGSSLTPSPGDSALVRTSFGALIPTPWTKSQTISDGTPVVHGDYSSFRVTTAEAHTGTFSLLIDPAPIGRRFAGAQQVLRVQKDGTYQASVWVKTNSASQEYRFVIRGVDEDLLQTASGGDALLQMTLTSGVWTEFSIPDVLVGDNTQIILRIANINVSGNPAIFYVDDGRFDEGMPPTTVGKMLEELYADATVDHAGRVVWEDEDNPGTPYLALDFDDVNDSDGVPWDRSDVALTFRPRMSYLQVMQTIVNEGDYEWRIVPATPPVQGDPGYYLWQVFNPGGLGGSVAAAVQGGSTDTTRSARYFAPSATDVVVQGQNQISARAQDSGLVSAFGRIEGSELDQNITTLSSAAVAASGQVAGNRTGAEDLVYTLSNPNQEPLTLYRPGDTIQIEDPPLISGQRRVSQIVLSVTKERATEFTVHFSDAAPFKSYGGVQLARGLTSEAAITNAVVGLLRKFENPGPLPAPSDVQVGGGGGAPTVVIAAQNSSEFSKSRADFIWDETISQAGLQDLMSGFTTGARILWCEGTFQFDGISPLTLPNRMQWEGMGVGTTIHQWFTSIELICIGNNGLRDMSFTVFSG